MPKEEEQTDNDQERQQEQELVKQRRQDTRPQPQSEPQPQTQSQPPREGPLLLPPQIPTIAGYTGSISRSWKRPRPEGPPTAAPPNDSVTVAPQVAQGTNIREPDAVGHGAHALGSASSATCCCSFSRWFSCSFPRTSCLPPTCSLPFSAAVPTTDALPRLSYQRRGAHTLQRTLHKKRPNDEDRAQLLQQPASELPKRPQPQQKQQPQLTQLPSTLQQPQQILRKVAPNKLVPASRSNPVGVTQAGATLQPQPQSHPLLQRNLRKAAPNKLIVAVAAPSPVRRNPHPQRLPFNPSPPPAKRIKLRGDEPSDDASNNDDPKMVKRYTDDAYRSSGARSSGRQTLTRVSLDLANTRVCPTIAATRLYNGPPCNNPHCRFRHDVSPEFTMPTCKYFQRPGGQQCRDLNCRFRHVKVDSRAPPCPSFERLGFCPDLDCPLLHRTPPPVKTVATKNHSNTYRPPTAGALAKG